MRDISKAVGISAAALYHHFPDKQRLYLDAMEYVFVDKAEGITAALEGSGSALAKELAPDCDPHMLAISMTGLVLFHFETAPIRRFLPGGEGEHNDLDVIARHVIRLLGKALGES